MFSSDKSTTLVDCSRPSSQLAVSALQELGLTCADPTWSSNSVSLNPSQPGYGATQAFPPATISVACPPFMDYVSNGSSSLPMVVRVLDQASQFVTAGEASFACSRHVSHASIHFICMHWMIVLSAITVQFC